MMTHEVALANLRKLRKRLRYYRSEKGKLVRKLNSRIARKNGGNSARAAFRGQLAGVDQKITEIKVEMKACRDCLVRTREGA